ncbi:hypothetical protein ACTOB_006068 [Actinoplanes oblitus]|uniref:Lipoprotein n=1 Tax=Actinoplanes oblitus TaxID=3040509 RepID=A0ABY8WAE5_9ACTN|nr:hypothetical protein [Actinoplanes oblitus]WIM94068.1 hypothetical protein ACTOB_006068 [Actinoplanes oblitus]
MIRRPAALLTLLLLAGCTDSGQETAAPATPVTPVGGASPAVCADGKTTFGKLSTTPVLIGVTPIVEITDRKGGPVNEPMEQVGTRTAGVAAEPGVPVADVYRALQEQKFGDVRLADLGTAFRPEENGTNTVDGPGRFVAYEYLRVVRAPFTWTCAGVKHPGTVTTWENGSDYGILDCDYDARDGGRPRESDAVYHQVRELRC